MALIQWQPFREMESWQREMNHLFESLSPTTPAEKRKAYIPPAEMRETPEAIHLRVELPGLDAKDIDIQVSAEAVSISGERKSISRTNAEGKKRSEFHYGAFRRVIPLPSRIQNTEVNAEYRDGILQLNLPKAESEKTKVVKVNIS
jgi:HSP20 family protein